MGDMVLKGKYATGRYVPGLIGDESGNWHYLVFVHDGGRTRVLVDGKPGPSGRVIWTGVSYSS